MSNIIKRPLIRYHGGKFRLASWIIDHFPKHKIYTEAFGGGGSILLKKQRSHAEIYNDMDGEIVNLFKIARDHGDELIRVLKLTPFSRDEFVASCIEEDSESDIERARKTVSRSFMGFGSASVTHQSTGFRSNSNRSGTTPARDWLHYPEHLPAIIERLRGVVIENKPAIDVLKKYDSSETLHYIDPPYLHSTRSKSVKNGKHCYKYEMADSDHEILLKEIKELKGMVVISGYDNDMYNDILNDWSKSYKYALADGARKRIEVLWYQPFLNLL
jgi:DNA adenine methylase